MRRRLDLLVAHAALELHRVLALPPYLTWSEVLLLFYELLFYVGRGHGFLRRQKEKKRLASLSIPHQACTGEEEDSSLTSGLLQQHFSRLDGTTTVRLPVRPHVR